MFHKAAQAHMINMKGKSEISMSKAEYWINSFVLVQIVLNIVENKVFLNWNTNLKDLFNAKIQVSVFKKLKKFLVLIFPAIKIVIYFF